MNEISKENLDLIKSHIKRAEMEVIKTETGFSYSYISKVLDGRRYNREIIVLATEIALGHKKQLDENIANLKNDSIFFREPTTDL